MKSNAPVSVSVVSETERPEAERELKEEMQYQGRVLLFVVKSPFKLLKIKGQANEHNTYYLNSTYHKLSSNISR